MDFNNGDQNQPDFSDLQNRDSGYNFYEGQRESSYPPQTPPSTNSNQQPPPYQNRDGYSYNNYSNTPQRPRNSWNGQEDETLSMGQWILIICAAMIPCAGFILYMVWAFGTEGNANRRNYCRASLIVSVGIFVLYFIFAFIVGVLAASM